MAANTAETKASIIENLFAGFDVLADWFYTSGVAYELAKEISKKFQSCATQSTPCFFRLFVGWSHFPFFICFIPTNSF